MHGSVLVLGAGIAGMRAALDLAEIGVRAILVETEPVVGGTMGARLSDTSETFSFGKIPGIPRPDKVVHNEYIELITLGELLSITGSPGSFTARIRRKARFVTDACTQCGRCHGVCPVVVPNEFQSGLSYRKAIYTPFRDAKPDTYAIDIDRCLNSPPNYLPCQRCVEVCDDHAIHFEMADQEIVREVSAVIVAIGYGLEHPATLERLGYGSHPNVLDFMELERLTSPVGPTGGYLVRPSDEEYAESVLYVVTDTSRFSCLCAAAQCDRLVEQEIKHVTVLHPPKTFFGDDFREFWARYSRHDVELIEAELERVAPQDDGLLRARYKPSLSQMSTSGEYDVIVFTTAVQPPQILPELAQTLGIELDGRGFAKLDDTEPGINVTTRQGVYVAGCISGPKDINGSIAQGKATAAAAMAHLDRRKKRASDAVPAGQTGVIINGKWLSQTDIQRRLEGVVMRLIDGDIPANPK